MFPRQRKGLLVLTLVWLTETVYLSNAVSSHQKIKARFQSSRAGEDSSLSQSEEECDADGICRATGVRRSFRKLLSQINQKQQQKDYCCQSPCSDCLDKETSERLCAMPRGGATELLAEAVSSTATPYNIPLNGWKVIFQAILTSINVACWLIPLRSKQISENKLALSLANAFSGGVFLSLAFGHLIPECVHGFDGHNEVLPYMLVLGGYLLIFFVEKVAFDAHDIMHELEHGKETAKAVSTGENGHAGPPATSSHTGRSAVILLGALAVHSILEMTALGLADTFGDCGLLTLSIALHQPAESIALLVAFLKSGLSEGEITKYLSIFSAMGPIGVAIGMAVNEFAAPIVDAVMLAIVAGTFVYVGATEVIPEEWEDSSNKWKKFISLMSGIVSIFVITQYTSSLEGLGS